MWFDDLRDTAGAALKVELRVDRIDESTDDDYGLVSGSMYVYIDFEL